MADWSDAEIRKVKTMWRHGATATEIADALGKGFTRGSVLGKIHRLGLKKAEEPKAKARPRVTATKPAARGPGPPSGQGSAESDGEAAGRASLGSGEAGAGAISCAGEAGHRADRIEVQADGSRGRGAEGEAGRRRTCARAERADADLGAWSMPVPLADRQPARSAGLVLRRRHGRLIVVPGP